MSSRKFKRFGVNCRGVLILFILLSSSFAPIVRAQNSPDANSAPANGTPDEKLAALNTERTNAINAVLKIVNQPVKAYVRSANIDVSTFQPGWFHDGATKPDFNTVDVRQSQETAEYTKTKFVTSDVNPGIVFLGTDLEFNAMTKYFYTNRALPKKKLTEAEMTEINRLYRIIGKCDTDIRQLKEGKVQAKSSPETAQAATTNETEEVIPGQPLESIRKIPIQTRMRYAAIAVGALLLLVIVLRLVKKKSE